MESFKSISLPDISAATLPMAFPSGKNKLPKSGVFLAADVGGTKTELALFQIKERKLVSIKNQRYPTSDHESFVKAIREFHDDKSLKIKSYKSYIYLCRLKLQ